MTGRLLQYALTSQRFYIMKLPIGYDNFEDLRNDQCYYVDKTDIIFDMLSKGRYYFLSRPRRFGKSLLVSTIQCLFEGKKELFKGLHIEDKWDWSKKAPVVKIGFTGDYKHPNDLEDDLNKHMKDLEEEHGAQIRDSSTPTYRFERIVRHLHKQTGEQVSVLIDDYDYPYFNHFMSTEDLELAEKNHDYIDGFYDTIKYCSESEDVGFIFVTGVVGFSHACPLRGGLDNLLDINAYEIYGNICGFTDHEIDSVFAKEIKTLDRDKIRHWYSGYSWNNGEEKLYNPYDILHLLDTQKFDDWWFQKETPSFMYKRLLTVCSFSLEGMESRENLEFSGSENSDITSFDLEYLQYIGAKAIFFQLGYITIIQKEATIYSPKYFLDFPNPYIRNGVYKGLLDVLSGDAERAKDQGKVLLNLLAKNDFATFEKTLHSYFNSLPHEFRETTRAESYFHSLLLTILYAIKSHYTYQHTIESTSTITIHKAGQTFCMKFQRLINYPEENLNEMKEEFLLKAIKDMKDDHYVKKCKESKDPLHLLAFLIIYPNRNFNGFKHQIFHKTSNNETK